MIPLTLHLRPLVVSQKDFAWFRVLRFKAFGLLRLLFWFLHKQIEFVSQPRGCTKLNAAFSLLEAFVVKPSVSEILGQEGAWFYCMPKLVNLFSLLLFSRACASLYSLQGAFERHIDGDDVDIIRPSHRYLSMQILGSRMMANGYECFKSYCFGLQSHWQFYCGMDAVRNTTFD